MPTCEQSEATDGEPDSAKEERLRTLADAGFDPIMAVGAAYAEEAQTVAKEYPDVKFAVIDGFLPGRQHHQPDLLRGAGRLPRGHRGRPEVQDR